MLTRSGFKKPQIERKRTVPTPIPLAQRRNAVFARMDVPAAPPIEKEDALRSEPYRRLVAAMPCAYCRREKHSQHAHTNGAQKGKGIKNDDRDAMPLCADDYGLPGCHSRFDRYALFANREEHRRMGEQWAAETRAAIEASGQWPKNLPRWTK
jgi:hypothetical protein